MAKSRIWKIADLGLAKVSKLGNNLTIVGTEGYKAPEMLNRLLCGSYTEKVDIWSTSVMFIDQIKRWVSQSIIAKNARLIFTETGGEVSVGTLYEYRNEDESCTFPLPQFSNCLSLGKRRSTSAVMGELVD